MKIHSMSSNFDKRVVTVAVVALWSVKLLEYFFEPTCVYCTVGSYVSLSVRLSVRHWIIIHISESIIAMNLKLCHSIKPS